MDKGEARQYLDEHPEKELEMVELASEALGVEATPEAIEDLVLTPCARQKNTVKALYDEVVTPEMFASIFQEETDRLFDPDARGVSLEAVLEAIFA